MKKTCALLLAAALCLVMLAGCSGAGKKISDSRWDGDAVSGAMNGYSIVFRGEKAYFGITYETESEIVADGLELTYSISGKNITFKSVEDERSVVMTYDGKTITDNTDPDKCAFEAGYVFTKR